MLISSRRGSDRDRSHREQFRDELEALVYILMILIMIQRADWIDDLGKEA